MLVEFLPGKSKKQRRQREETPQEYTKRITSCIACEQRLKVQTTTHKKLERLIKERPCPNCASALLRPSGLSSKFSRISQTQKSLGSLVSG
jgi:transcription elongation factor Elf1